MSLDPIPSAREELQRKTIEFVLDLDHAQKQEGLDALVAASMCKAVWTVTSGLVDGDVSSTLAAYADQIGPVPVRRHFVGRGRLLLLAFQARGSGYALLEIDLNTGAKRTLKSEALEPGERAEALRKLQSGLIEAGYVRV